MSKGRSHISPNGPGECSASKGKCPYGGVSGEENHFDSLEEAVKTFNDKMIDEHGEFTSLRKETSMADSDYTRDELRIIKSNDPDETTYDVLEELNGKLSESEARGVMEAGYQDVNFALDDDTKRMIFETAGLEAGVYDESDEPEGANWTPTFNEYRSYMKIIKYVRGEEPESLKADYPSVKALAEAKNSDSYVFAEFRKRPGMNEAEAQQLMEHTFQTTTSRISQNARNELFNRAYERQSENGYGSVFSIYANDVNIVNLTVPDQEERPALKERLQPRLNPTIEEID